MDKDIIRIEKKIKEIITPLIRNSGPNPKLSTILSIIIHTISVVLVEEFEKIRKEFKKCMQQPEKK